MHQPSYKPHNSLLAARQERGKSPLGWLGLLLFPVAALFYLIALPFFVVLWVLEFFLPRHPDEPAPQELPEDPQVEFPGHGAQEFKLP
jgi:hypothetical protein